MKKDPRVEKLRRLKDMQAARREAIDVTIGAMEQLYADKQREIDNKEIADETHKQRHGGDGVRTSDFLTAAKAALDAAPIVNADAHLDALRERKADIEERLDNGAIAHPDQQERWPSA